VTAAGDEGAVDQLIEWCKRGPSHASVDSVDVEDLTGDPPTGPFQTN
jgi:acylphosphatase